MKILHMADQHLGLASYGRPVEEFGATLMTFSRAAVLEQVDVAVIAGDLFHSRRPGPAEILLAVRAIRVLTEAGIDTVIGPGNHDGMGTIADPGSHTLAWMAELALNRVHVATGPELIETPKACFAVLPYAHRRSIESTATLRERTDEASRVLEQTINDLGARQLARGRGVPNVFVGHLTTVSARLGSEAAMQLGWDTTVDPAVFDRFDVACLGHIHVRQVVSEKAFYAGSPDVHGFDDQPAEEKGFWLHEGDQGTPWTHRFVPSRPRAFLTIDVAEGFRQPVEIPTGAVVRLRFLDRNPSPASIRERVAFLKDAGASFVKVVVPEPERRYRGQSAELGELPIKAQMERWLEVNGHPKEPALSIAVDVISSFSAE